MTASSQAFFWKAEGWAPRCGRLPVCRAAFWAARSRDSALIHANQLRRRGGATGLVRRDLPQRGSAAEAKAIQLQALLLHEHGLQQRVEVLARLRGLA
eukprot:CAMPEP_0171122144 /NCGR_PEP_ID=MMETSP0766_2-20121228/104356_1 /TAXON_ID=439317 /ORGANISM="Gambierdiscus australes, Strain CAWD 149" /LENGTH=97 /DNA_ID=CAMNT_0011584967 /DNA_START=28 /DNA_END=319 /DNA_ORIENTATION=-